MIRVGWWRGALTLWVMGCRGDGLPPHRIESVTSLKPRTGQRVEIRVDSAITSTACFALLAHYRDQAAPDGQVLVRRPLETSYATVCVDNLDGRPPQMMPDLWETAR